jgi:hypothetical protein
LREKRTKREQMIYIMHTSQPTENCIASHKVLIKRESKENNPRARRGLWRFSLVKLRLKVSLTSTPKDEPPSAYSTS